MHDFTTRNVLKLDNRVYQLYDLSAFQRFSPPPACPLNSINSPRRRPRTALRPKTAQPVEDFFSTDHLRDDLRGHSVRGGLATLTTQAATFLLKLGSIAILARLLTPEDFGLIAMVTALTGFMEMFKDAGLSMATVQRAEISHDQISTLFWINLALSAVLMVLMVAFAPAVARFYGQPRLLWITVALAPTFLFGGMTVQHQAILNRQMRFAALGMIQVASQAVGIAAAITAAALGLRYWALVIMTAAVAAANTVAVWLFSGWRPGLPKSRSGVRPMLDFGANLMGFGLLNYIVRNADNVMIGRYCGAAALGLYARAYQIFLLPLSQLFGPFAAVVTPALSRVQNDPQRFRRYYCMAATALAYSTLPLMVVLIVCARETVSVFLGPKWLDAVPIFLVLALGGLLQPIASLLGSIFIALGQTDRQRRWATFVMPVFWSASRSDFAAVPLASPLPTRFALR